MYCQQIPQPQIDNWLAAHAADLITDCKIPHATAITQNTCQERLRAARRAFSQKARIPQGYGATVRFKADIESLVGVEWCIGCHRYSGDRITRPPGELAWVRRRLKSLAEKPARGIESEGLRLYHIALALPIDRKALIRIHNGLQHGIRDKAKWERLIRILERGHI